MGRRGRKRRLDIESEYWRLVMSDVGTVDACRRLGVARNTVRAALASDRPPKYQRAAKGSIVDDYESRIRAFLAEWPTMLAPVLAERIGWPHSIWPLRKRLALIRPSTSGSTS